MTRTGQTWSWLRKVGAWFSGVVFVISGAARSGSASSAAFVGVGLAMHTPSFVETTPNRPGTARLQSKSSWFDVVWSRWHADGRWYAGHSTVRRLRISATGSIATEMA